MVAGGEIRSRDFVCVCVHNGRNNNLYTDVNYIRREEKLNKKTEYLERCF